MLQKELIQTLGQLSREDFHKYWLKLEDEELQKEAVIYRCATDKQLFAELFFPHYCNRNFNEFQTDFFKKSVYGERNVRRATAGPRGVAKSTVATLINTVHDVCYGLEKFIVIISSTTPLSNKKLKDIRMEIYTNVELCDYYGLKFPKKKAGESEFLIIADLGQTHLMAVGRGSEMRGIRIGNTRPTKFVLDDVEFSEEVYNEKSRRKTEDWFFEDVGKAGDTGTNIEFVGTVLHKESLLAKLLRNPAYDSALYKSVISWSEREDLWNEWRKIYRNVDNPNRLKEADEFYQSRKDEMLKGTKVIWPEKEDYLAHMKDMEEIGRRAFMKEKQNDPQGTEEPIFERIQWYREEPEGLRIESNGELIKWDSIKHRAMGAMDPSTGQVKSTGGKLGDYTVILSGYHDPKGRVLVHHDFTKRVSPTKYIQEVFELHEKFNYEKFALETNLYRNLLLPNMIDEQKRREKEKKKSIKIPFYEVVQTENKMERIYRLEPKVNHGYILFNRALSKDFMNQVVDFPFSDHDDGPDCLEILWNLAHNRYRASALSMNAMSGY